MVDDEVVQGLSELATSNVGDAMQRLRVCDSAIQTRWAGAHLAGRALTVTTRAGDNQALHDALATARPGDVMVVNGEADVRRALVGDLIASRARARGITGFVVDGAVRDVATLKDMGMPVFARAETPAGPYKHGPGLLDEPAAIGGVVVMPGDIVLGDDDGVVVVPAAQAVEVLAAARKVSEQEETKRALIAEDLRAFQSRQAAPTSDG